MGTLTRFDLRGSGCVSFFETGTGTGKSLRHVIDTCGFRNVYSVEIHGPTAVAARKRFEKDSHVEIIESDSNAALERILPGLSRDEPMLLFLDAHFPGEVEADAPGYDQVVPDETSLPLARELSLVAEHRAGCRDVIIVDDLKLYEDGDYENGNIAADFANIPQSLRNLDFIPDLFPDHDIDRDLRDDGYLVIRPRGLEYRMKELTNWFRFRRNLRRHLARLTGRTP